MNSVVGWIDFSSEHREKVRTALDMLRSPGVVDELGVGAIRDSFADYLFPGISTIQTRPKYFTLIPVLLRRYQQQKTTKAKTKRFEDFLREKERACRTRLLQAAESDNAESGGIIGATFGDDEKRGVVRRPSSVYWNGICKFGIVSPKYLSLSEFGRRIIEDRNRLKTQVGDGNETRGDDRDASHDDATVTIVTPDVSPDYLQKLSIELTRSEAEFLHQQITSNQPDSLLGQVLMDENLTEEVLSLPLNASFEAFSELSSVRGLRESNEKLFTVVTHARDFWRIFEGAHILYNWLLQERFGTHEKCKEYEQRWIAWQANVLSAIQRWDKGIMHQVVQAMGRRIQPSTEWFLDGWIKESRKSVPDLENCRRLVSEQERYNKRERARLRKDHKESVQDWVGIGALNYRFPQVNRLVKDIAAGFAKENEANV